MRIWRRKVLAKKYFEPRSLLGTSTTYLLGGTLLSHYLLSNVDLRPSVRPTVAVASCTTRALLFSRSAAAAAFMHVREEEQKRKKKKMCAYVRHATHVMALRTNASKNGIFACVEGNITRLSSPHIILQKTT